MKTIFAIVALFSLGAPAAAFGISFGVPLEERVGGDYGPEYYRAMQARRCHSMPAKTRQKLEPCRGKSEEKRKPHKFRPRVRHQS
jgi:hypothetical protein